MEESNHQNVNITLPNDFGVLNFIEHRIQEINVLTRAIESPKQNGLVFQRLPVHMRRRVMGHSSKRMPRSVREAHIKQLQKSGFPPKPKRPSRRHRRRPKNLLSEYNRRQKTFVWLETHIWHAKRFHMTEKWGYKLPLHCNDKSVRASYKAAANHCLLTDMSYLVCIELQGEESILLDLLSHVCDPACGPTFAAKSLLGGQYEGQLTVYYQDKYPYSAIGTVKFLWKPPSNENCRTIWLWSHPSYYQEIVTLFVALFDLTLTDIQHDIVIGGGQEAEKLAMRAVPPVYNNPQSGVNMTLLKDHLGRFKLTGPLAHCILQQVLTPPQVKQKTEAMDIDDIFSSLVKPSSVTDRVENSEWCQGYYNSAQRHEELRAQTELWQSIGGVTSPAQMPPHCVLGLTVTDPRLNMPYKRTKAQPNSEPLPCLAKLPAMVSNSPIWNHKIRTLVTSEKKTDFEINRQRSENLVPGWCEQETQLLSTKLPLLLIQSPGSQDKTIKKIGLGCAWDIIIPAGWNMPLLRSLILQGARVGGLRELEAFGTESQMPCAPLCSPDTNACKLEQESRTQAALNEHFRKPPNKRSNYIKLGIATPFGAPWLQLVQEWCCDEDLDEFYVLRDQSRLNNMKLALTSGVEYTENDANCLVLVSVVLSNGGALDSWALICLPETRQDLTGVLFENTHVDINELDRKERREKHQQELKAMSRKRSKERKKEEPVEPDGATEKAEQFEAAMRLLWIPSPCQLKHLCDRKLAGFVTQGMYRNAEARAAGVGFITEPAFRALLGSKSWNKSGDVLVRCTQTLRYKTAKLKILC